jgi:hypothetical protein
MMEDNAWQVRLWRNLRQIETAPKIGEHFGFLLVGMSINMEFGISNLLILSSRRPLACKDVRPGRAMGKSESETTRKLLGLN